MNIKLRYECSFQKSNVSEVAWDDYNSLKKAIRCRDIDQVKNLILRGVRVNGKHKNHAELTPLHQAVTSRCPEIVKILLDEGANVNDHDVNWDTPITVAAKTGDTAVIDLVLSYNVQHYSSSRENLSHLHVACMRNNLSVVRKLVSVDNGRTINNHVSKHSPFWPGFTPLHFAVYYGSIQTVEYLLKCGANILAEDSKKLTPLHWADLRRNEAIVDLLLAAHKYEFKNPQGSCGLSHFHIACTRDDTSIVEHFLNLGVDMNHEVEGFNHGHWLSWKPIHFAMYYGCPKVVELLLESKADYKIDAGLQWLPDFLECAYVTRNDIIYDLFTKSSIQYNQGSKPVERCSNFHLACINNNVKEMRAWLSENSSLALTIVNAPLWNGYKPLHLAAKCDSLGVMKLLLTNGADIMAQDSQGKTPLHIAFGHNSKLVKNIIKSLPVGHENVTDDTGLSLLHILCTTDEDEKIENLLKKEINVNMRVNENSDCWANFTPMHFACEFKKLHIVKLLLKYNADIYIKNGSISDHFSLVFEEFFEQWFLTGLQELLYQNLMAVFSSPSTQIKYSNDCKISPLHVLCMDDARSTLEKYLTSHKNEINQAIEMPHSRKYHKCTPLHLALRFHHFQCAKLMLKAGADPLLLNGIGETPLESTQYGMDGFRSCSAKFGDFFSQEILIKSLKPSHFFIACCAYAYEFLNNVLNTVEDQKLKDSYVNCRDDVNQTPLHPLAYFQCQSERDSSERKKMLELLLKNGANVNAKDYLLSTPLHEAHDEKVMRLLMDYGADVNARNIDGRTPLHTTCAKSKNYVGDLTGSILALLDNGADIEIEDKHGLTCMMILSDSKTTWNNVEESAILLLKHYKKLELIGFNVSKANECASTSLLSLCHEDFNENTFKNECTRELEMMKLKHIDRYTTVYDILFKSLNEMTLYCENNVLQSIFGSSKNGFPIYGPLIRLQLKKGKIRKPLLKSSQTSMNLLFGKSLPNVCSEMILDHLSDTELKNVIASVSSLIETSK